jgi:putative endonuclease
MAATDTLGKNGEERAVLYLQERGYQLIDRNWRCAQGEIDIIVQRGDETVFVEVKTRSTVAFGHPFEAITAAKLARLKRLTATWCAQADRPVRRVRLDAVAVIGAGDDAVVEHLAGVG